MMGLGRRKYYALLKKARKYHEDAIKAMKPKIDQALALKSMLEAAGFSNVWQESQPASVNVSYYNNHFKQEDLPKLARVTGPLELNWSEVYSPEKCEVKVVLKSKKWPCLFVSYIKVLDPSDSCRIVTKTEVQHDLVCERKLS